MARRSGYEDPAVEDAMKKLEASRIKTEAQFQNMLGNMGDEIISGKIEVASSGGGPVFDAMIAAADSKNEALFQETLQDFGDDVLSGRLNLISWVSDAAWR